MKEQEGFMPFDTMREHFERTIKDTPMFASNTPLGPITVNGKFTRYMDPDTDTMWLGFALGVRCAERLARKATQ